MANSGERVTDIACTEDKLIIDLADGQSISAGEGAEQPIPSCIRSTAGEWVSISQSPSGLVMAGVIPPKPDAP